MGSNNNNVEIPNWLKKLPLAPTYYPTDTEFADPIAYISKIEKEASAFGICKVVPPLPKPAKKYVFSNLNKSLLKFPELSASPSSSSSQTTCSGDNVNNSRATNGEHSRGVFTTRHQELGSTLKKTKPQVSLHQSPVHKQVWQSGEAYTLEQFESKAKSFARNQLGMIKQVTPRVVEALFWKAASEKPIYIEYANDVPGSGFGEPEELSRYFHRRRRRRRRGQYNQNHQESPDNENHNTDASRNSYVNKEKIVFANNDSDSSSQPLNSSALSSDESSRFRREKSSTVGNDREGTAGWKLSNSPWNLQVIARSPGSLTRFMLDDIPGVTSPMIYIGMLFSWFAWHVEDHELHSLNFLHTGSSKTWYAVPGDYAFCFEEVIRSKGYGGDLDRLAALTLLGEKTNLLSPEVVIASGLPCCRLVQHPGEFVVTFPRAYHIGFSHGFNCGEAANFGTPQWLKVAKAAAVRRAAMNYLPMLSHQQLLYMLTMSFVSSVPRALHPGARTSRLKDRQKEERELLVKKAFVDDMLNEKYLFMALLGKESTFYGVLWDPEALPSPGTVPNNTSTVSALSTGITFVDHQCDDSYNNNIDSARMSMEALEEFYVGDDDLPCGLRVDSGTLPCVACGVLGFPFMSIVQPSRRASEELFPAECQVTQGLEVSRSMKPTAPSDLYDAVMKSTSDAHICDEHQKVSSAGRSKVRLTDNDLWNVYNDAINFEANETVELKETTSLLFQSNVDHPAVFGNSQVSLGQPLHSTGGSLKKWNTSNEFLRPRVFCLEHALEIEELLRTKGGANVLIICHSAYPKIKAHALAVAEEIGAPFDCDEIPLQCASKEDMNLITVSIEDDEHEECGEDWTSRLGLNLHYCVKLRKLSSTKQAQHALALGGLFSDVFSGLDHLSFKWKSRRSRTPYKTAGPRQSNSCGSVQIKKSEALLEVTLKRNAAEEHKVIQYSRRSSNHKVVSTLQTCGEHRGRSKLHHCRDVISNTGVLDKNISKDTLCCTENGANDSVELNKSFTVNSGVQHKDCAREEATEINEIFHPPRFSDLLSSENTHIDVSKLAKSSALKTSEVLHDECTIVVKEGTSDVCDPVKCEGLLAIKTIENDSELSRVPSVENHNVCVTEETREVREVSDYAVFSVSLAIASSEAETLEAPLKDHILDYEGDGAFNFVTVDTAKNQHMITLTDEKYEMSNIVADPMESPSSQPIVISSVEIETDTLEEDRVEYEVCNNAILGISERQVENQTTYAHSYLSSTTVESSEVRELQVLDVNKGGEVCSPAPDTMMRENSSSVMFKSQPTKKERCKRRRELDQITEDEWSYNGYIKSPCEGLRPRINRITTSAIRSDKTTEVETVRKKFKRSPNGSVTGKEKKVKDDELHKCDIEGCQLIFKTMGQLMMHKRNRCTHKGCGKQFRSHSYAMLHQRVHVDERPLKCSWKGCTMSFKWAWARTEHLRVHTGERPYQCKIEGCGLTFRFVSDFSRHRRKSGHYVDSPS